MSNNGISSRRLRDTFGVSSEEAGRGNADGFAGSRTPVANITPITMVYDTYICSQWGVYMCASQITRSGTWSGTTPVLYPPFHTPVPYLLEGSVPYLCSIPLFYICTYLHIHIFIYIYIHILHIFEHV